MTTIGTKTAWVCKTSVRAHPRTSMKVIHLCISRGSLSFLHLIASGGFSPPVTQVCNLLRGLGISPLLVVVIDALPNAKFHCFCSEGLG